MVDDSTDAAWTITEALSLMGAAVLSMALGSWMFSDWGLGGLIATQAVFLGGPTLLYAKTRGALRRQLALCRPSLRSTLGAVLFGASIWLLLAIATAPLVKLLGGEAEEQRLGQLLDGGPTWLLVIAVALAPAVFEELLFRGVLARALVSRMPEPVAALLSALLFGAFHLSAVRWFPTAILGLFLAYAIFRTASVLPCMIIHFLNNAGAILVSRVPPNEWQQVLEAHGATILLAALLAASLGAYLFLTDSGRFRPLASP